MKPECRRVLEQIAALSADDLSPAEAEAVRRHMEECPPCKGQWVLFERTLFTLSATPQAVIPTERSHEMWLVCLEHAQQNSSDRPNKLAPAPHVAATVSASQKASNSSKHAVEQRPFWEKFGEGIGWLTVTPRLGWVLAGGAAVALGAAYMLAPEAPGEAAPAPRFALPAMPSDNPGNLVEFQRPSRASSMFVDHHSAMSFEPYGDHVGPAMAYSAAYSPDRQ